MKRIIYIFLLAVSGSFVITSCTEEEVKPQTEFNGGAAGSTGEVK
jgi:hypothetical protein